MQKVNSKVLAAGSVTGATGAAVWARGCATARTAVGVYTITLPDGGADAAECAVLCSVRGATRGVIDVVHTSDTVKTVSTWTAAGAAQDTDFDFVVIQGAIGTSW